ncbi:MAG: hypothetical protein HQK68_08650 [Desulfamplus sp.]|nr:hypothetical protein [Desulfamplus sp.]
MKCSRTTNGLICLITLFSLTLASSTTAFSEEATATQYGSSETAELSLSTDKDVYRTGDIMQFTISMSGDATVDIYMTATFPDESFASYSASMVPDSGSAVVPLAKAIPLATIGGTYTLPLVVVPLFPEGESAIWIVFVKSGKNPMVYTNWLAEDTVYFTIDQNEDIEPILDLENKTLSASVGEIGTIEIIFSEATIEDGSVSGTAEGAIVVTGPLGTTREHEMTGTYLYEDKSLTIYLEDDGGFYIDLNLSISEDGKLTGSYETSEGKSGDVEFNIPVDEELS